MCTERYLSVTKPLDTVRRSKSYRKALAWGVWLLSLFLSVPMMVMVSQTQQRVHGGGVKRICAPALAPLAYKVYVTVLFGTSIMARDSSSEPKVLIMIFTIVLVFWACFLPFWIWQLLDLYVNKPLNMASETKKCINYLVAKLREYLKNRHRSFYRYTSSFKQRPPSLYSWGKSSSNQFEFNSETLVMGTLR
ncbi:hypothetical protein F7725_013852 [Dissostichus mawsoni]|uniref:G-protein coupled receptors family 1 profile domain-containing protein n=1 Tax=Dissostichus mawsoni TaxID=36200 RepID=A0A7J5YU85_DISMA|nr:hypothetical protein F7725_013852 [Dissostichus mawsoni]